MKSEHFTDYTPQDIGILEDALNGLLDANHMSATLAQRVWYLQLEGLLLDLKPTKQGKAILESLNRFRESLK